MCLCSRLIRGTSFFAPRTAQRPALHEIVLHVDDDQRVHNSKLNPLLLELAVFCLVETEEPCRPVGDVLFDFIGLDQQIHAEDFFAKIPFIERRL